MSIKTRNILISAGALFAGILAAAALAGCAARPAAGTTPAAPAIQFRDVTQAAGLQWTRINGAFGKKWMPETMGGGGAFLDYDNDGWLDILLVNGDYWPGHQPAGASRPTLALYHNNHDGTFTDVTKQAGLDVPLQGMGVAVGDYDNDGYNDLFITSVGRSRLFHNVPDGHGGRRFADVTQESGIQDVGWSTSAAWVDYDGDGKIDLFVCHYVKWSPETDVFCGSTAKVYCRPSVYAGESSRLYHNDGNGRFHDVSKQTGIYNPEAKALAVCVCDIDKDARPDLIVANDMEPTFVFHNNGNGTFSEIGVPSGIAYDKVGHARAGMGIDAVDYRNNGSLGVAIGDFSLEGMAFYEIGGPPPYLDRASEAGVLRASYPYVTFGVLFADFDNDGWSDLFATNGDIEDSISNSYPNQTYPQSNLLMRNNGAGVFVDVSRQAGAAVTNPLVGRGACSGDFDNDGRPDILLIPNFGPPRLLHNETSAHNHWLAVRLVGTRSNRDGFGGQVSVTAGGITRTGYVHSGSSYLSSSDRRLYFGLGSSAEVSSITVRWPGGMEEKLGPLAADQTVSLTEGQSNSPASSSIANAIPAPIQKTREVPPKPATVTALQQGAAALNHRDMASATQIFERAVQADPNSGLARDYLGIAYLKQGRYAEALKQFQAEARIEPDPSTAWARIADVHYSQRNVKAAIGALERAVALRPDIAQFHYNLGMLYPQALELNKGVESLGRCSVLEPDNENVHYQRGILLYKLARLDDAERELNEALRLAPNVGGYHFALAQVYFRRTASREMTERARGELQKALDYGAPEPAAIHYYLGLCFQRNGDWEAARRELQNSVQMAPEAWGAFYALAEVEQKLGHTEESRKARARFAMLRAKEDVRMKRSFYTQEVMRNPESADARYQLAAFLLQQGDRRGAGESLARARRLAQTEKDNAVLRRRIAALSLELQRK